MDMETRLAVAALLLDRDAVLIDTERGFKLKLHEKDPSAPLSPFYLNLRSITHPNKPGPLTGEDIDFIAMQLFESARNIHFDGVAGIPEAGNPLAKAFWQIISSAGRRPILLEKKQDQNGKRRITGILDHGGCEPGDIILLIDDLLTGAHSKIEAIEVLRANGYLVHDVLIIVDREQGGDEELLRIECNLHALLTLTAILCFGVHTGRVTAQQDNAVRSYLAAENQHRMGGSP